MIIFSVEKDVNNLIEIEKNSLRETLNIQKKLNTKILKFVKNFTNNLSFINSDYSIKVLSNDEFFSYLDNAVSKLNQSNSNISLLTTLMNILETINISENIENSIQNYNRTSRETMDIIYANNIDIEHFIYEINYKGFSNNLETNASEAQNISISDFEKTSINTNTFANELINTESDSDLDSPFKENTLIISERQKKVFLLYKLSNIISIFENNPADYSSIEDVINKLYTIPIENYRFSSFSRFKEAYNLVAKKEKQSKLKALALAFELLINYSLHPAIITACNSIDELDIYLACLEENTLEDFHFFKIEYEIPLATSKYKLC